MANNAAIFKFCCFLGISPWLFATQALADDFLQRVRINDIVSSITQSNQEPIKGTIKQPTSLVLNLDKSQIDSKAIATIGDYGAKTQFKFDKNTTLDELIAQHCPDFPDLYKSYVQTRIPSLKENEDFKVGDEIAMPACPKFNVIGTKTKVVNSNEDVPYNQFKVDSAGLNWNDVSDRNLDDPLLGNKASYFDIFQKLNPHIDASSIKKGTQIILPSSRAWVDFKLDENVLSSAGTVKPEVAEAIAVGFDAQEEVKALPVGLFHVAPSMTLTADQIKQDCGDTAGGSSEINATRAQMKLMTLLAKNSVRLRKMGISPYSPVVVIPDSGLYRATQTGPVVVAPAQPLMSDENSLPLPPEIIAAGNAQIDGEMLASHGTAVDSIVRGGPSLDTVIEALGYTIRVTPINLFQRVPGYCPNNQGANVPCIKGELQPERLFNAIATPQQAIWNLSVGQGTEITPLRNVISNPASNELFIVAAGNTGLSLAESAIYPANYGGDAGRDWSIITVAALNKLGKLARFSSFGRNVDIAAPGCDIEAYGFDLQNNAPKIKEWTGTSFAAPAVTFVAAMLRSYNDHWTVKDIKHRILASADYDGDLSQGIFLGRTLNVLKTLSIFDDVVSVGPERKLLNGTVADTALSLLSCADLPHPSRSNVKQIVKGELLANGSQKLTVYYENVGNLLSTSCSSSVSTIDFTPTENFPKMTVQWAEINDITFSALRLQ